MWLFRLLCSRVFQGPHLDLLFTYIYYVTFIVSPSPESLARFASVQSWYIGRPSLILEPRKVCVGEVAWGPGSPGLAEPLAAITCESFPSKSRPDLGEVWTQPGWTEKCDKTVLCAWRFWCGSYMELIWGFASRDRSTSWLFLRLYFCFRKLFERSVLKC